MEISINDAKRLQARLIRFTCLKSICFMSLLVGLLVSLSSSYVYAANVHTHGVSTMTIAVDNNIVDITLTTPTSDLVGFEHRAHSESNKRAIKEMNTVLGKVEELFVLNGGACQFVSHRVDIFEQPEIQHNDDTNYGQIDEHRANEPHNDVTAYYQFNCENMSALSSIAVKVFTLFPSIHHIRSMWITDTHQGAVTLSVKNNMISLR
ncbi:ZrgA family zinc uptake protein [Shewanella frigidimarina]|uniref:DUF2796 domain-containing protein n=1 Tax=Shewanella frigidimarina TaxID=56812 RepID=A0A106BZI9_SHEFR|nr:DUF2796 domain-containing protein [Shewanella frigidimarina]KVX01384.1 hypothetical protein AWJ07_17760 [Shewanella frigidimarina]